jgi:hypothetical protein
MSMTTGPRVILVSLLYHYYATLAQIQMNKRTFGMLKYLISTHVVRAHSRTLENRLPKTAKPLFIGSIPIAASKFFHGINGSSIDPVDEYQPPRLIGVGRRL